MDDISAAVIQLYNQILKPNFFQKNCVSQWIKRIENHKAQKSY